MEKGNLVFNSKLLIDLIDSSNYNINEKFVIYCELNNKIKTENHYNNSTEYELFTNILEEFGRIYKFSEYISWFPILVDKVKYLPWGTYNVNKLVWIDNCSDTTLFMELRCFVDDFCSGIGNKMEKIYPEFWNTLNFINYLKSRYNYTSDIYDITLFSSEYSKSEIVGEDCRYWVDCNYIIHRPKFKYNHNEIQGTL